MRDLIEIIEIASQRMFYHGTRQPIRIGAILRPRGLVNHHEAEEHAVEAILEHFRPAGRLARGNSVFMVDRPDADLIEKAGGYAEYVYQVAPSGQVDRNDVHWWAEIYSLGGFDYTDDPDRTLTACQSMANAYWAGQPSERPRWEFRAAAARVIRLIK